jgi:hypothetical protein
VCARSSNSCCLGCTFRSLTTPRSLFDCLVDRFGPRRFNTLAPLDSRLSGSQRNVIVSRTRAQVCYVLDSWLRHYASDFLADSELFADCCAFLGAGARPHALAQRPVGQLQ